MTVIGLCGKTGAGKTTLASYLVQKHGFSKVSFSDPLKKALIDAGLLTHEEAYITRPPHARVLMQRIGTDLVRNQIDRDFWCRKTRQTIHRLLAEGVSSIVIDDVRFFNEYLLVRQLSGTVIKVVCTIQNQNYSQEILNHESETEVENIPFDFVIHNDRTPLVFEKLEAILSMLK